MSKETLDLFQWEPEDKVKVNKDVKFPDIIVSLFEHSGYATMYWRKAGYQVIQIDTKLGFDIMEWDYKALDFHRVVGMMAFPPCTHFTVSGAQYWDKKDEDGRTDEAVKLVEKTLEIKDYLMPKWWFIENPVGRIADLVPRLQSFGPFYFHPYEYGDPWKKKTALYGKFKPPAKEPVTPIQEQDHNGNKYSPIHMQTGGDSEATKEIRSVTPQGFSEAFFNANKNSQYN